MGADSLKSEPLMGHPITATAINETHG
ncbi:MAG: hypothetical protein QOF34_708, partial [Sphingomonadales bacterium]|nr:hypothetical protein [Sphingomonadales bacterium]